MGCILLIPVALSLGELGSSMPTAGGLYYVGSKAKQKPRTWVMTRASGLQD